MKHTTRGASRNLVIFAMAAVIALAAVAFSQLRSNTEPWPSAQRVPPSFGVWNDFLSTNDYNTTQYTVTLVEAGAGESDPVLSDVGGGALKMTTDAADDDANTVTNNVEFIDLDAGDTIVFNWGFTTAADVTELDLGAGIIEKDTDWLGDTAYTPEGIFFEKNDGDAVLDLVLADDATAVGDYTRQTGIVTLAASTNYDITMVVNVDPTTVTQARIRVWVNGVLALDKLFTTDVPSDSDDQLTYSMAVQAGEAAAKTVTQQYIGVAENRNASE